MSPSPSSHAATAGGIGLGASAGDGHVLEEVKPTGLISTAAVERRLHPEIGEEVDVAARPNTLAGGATSDTLNKASATTGTAAGGTAGATAGAITSVVAGAGAGAGNGPARTHPGLRFLPTEAWLAGVKPEQALNTLMRLLRYLVPQVAELG